MAGAVVEMEKDQRALILSLAAGHHALSLH